MSDLGMIELRNGDLRFPARAMGSGPAVLCLHGFPDSYDSFDAQLPALAAAGYRAIAPAMRGYAPSCQPADGDYHAVRMAEDVGAWAAQLGEPVHLIGHDWGATIGFAAARARPELFASLTVIAVPQPLRFAERIGADAAQLERSSYILFFQQPEAEAAILADDMAYLVRLWTRWSPGWQVPASRIAAMKAIFAQPGVPAAALAWYRQALDAGSAAATATQAILRPPLDVPTLGICGEDDGCIAADVFAACMQPNDFNAGLRLERVAGAGHFVHTEAPMAVNRLLIDWLALHRR